MSERWRNREWIVSSGNRMSMSGAACWIFGAVFAVLGILADIMNVTLGLEMTTWLMLSIALFVAGISWYIGWAVAVYVSGKEAKGK